MMIADIQLLLIIAALGLIVIGISGLTLSYNLFRIILALGIAEAGANLLLVLAGYRWGAVAPILQGDAPTVAMVDPVPQAMVLTAIVIGVGVQALALGLTIRVWRRYHTLDMREVKHRLDSELNNTLGCTPDSSQDTPAGDRPLTPPVSPESTEGSA